MSAASDVDLSQEGTSNATTHSYNNDEGWVRGGVRRCVRGGVRGGVGYRGVLEGVCWRMLKEVCESVLMNVLNK